MAILVRNNCRMVQHFRENQCDLYRHYQGKWGPGHEGSYKPFNYCEVLILFHTETNGQTAQHWNFLCANVFPCGSKPCIWQSMGPTEWAISWSGSCKLKSWDTSWLLAMEWNNKISALKKGWRKWPWWETVMAWIKMGDYRQFNKAGRFEKNQGSIIMS